MSEERTISITISDQMWAELVAAAVAAGLAVAGDDHQPSGSGLGGGHNVYSTAEGIRLFSGHNGLV